MNNLDIRKAIEENNLKYWQVANRLGMTDGNFSRLLRLELKDDDKEKILKAIQSFEKERKVWSKKKSYTQRKM